MKITKKTGSLPFNLKFLAIFSIIIGIFILIRLEWYCIFFFIFGISIFTINFGFEIDTNVKKWRKYFQIYGIKIGEWVNLHKINYLSISQVKQVQNFGILSLTQKINYMKFKLNIIYEDKKHDTLFVGKKEVILITAKKIAKEMNLKIYDATEKIIV